MTASNSNGAGALALLWKLKWRGRIRGMRAKMRTPLGALSLIVGLLLIGLWGGAIIFRTQSMNRVGDPPSPEVIRLGLLGYLAFITFSSLSLRGVYLPKPEVERLFAAPLRPASIVRFRLASSIFAALPFILIMSAFLAPRFASLGVAVAALIIIVPTTTVFGQAISLAAAKETGIVDRVLRRVPEGVLRTLGVFGILGAFLLVGFGPGLESGAEVELRDYVRDNRPPGSALSPLPSDEVSPGKFERVATLPVVATLTKPLTPWASALGATNLRAAAPWLALIAMLFVLMFEGVARLPIDFRETSLRTSQAFEKRLARIRRGQGGASAFGPSKGASKLRAPWLFGRSPFGAIVWLRTALLVRQSRGTLLIAGVVAVGGIFVGTRMMHDSGGETAALALIGVVYLASGLRADFRTDLDRMESIKAWPLRPRKTFAATILPCVMLTTVVIWFVLAVRAAVLQRADLSTLGVLLAVPPLAYLWSAIDNAIFLLFPIRMIPGQGSGIHMAGRGFLLLILRGIVVVAALSIVGAGGALIYMILDGRDDAVAHAAVVSWCVFVTCLTLWLVTLFGGWALGRYDVSRVPPST